MAPRAPDEPDVFDRVAMTLPQAAEKYSLEWRVMRWRIYTDMTPHYFGAEHSRLMVREAELVPWHRTAIREGLAGAPRERWPLQSIMGDVTTPQPIYSFISCSLRQAADRTGVSEATLTRAINDGWLTAHRAGDKGGRIVLRAQDLDAWVQSLPQDSPLERSWSNVRAGK